MDKTEFLLKLKARISALPQNEIDERLEYYAELISDMTEDGMSEQDAINQLGGVDKVAADIYCEQPLGALMRARVRPKAGWTVMNITLLILGSPVWLPILIALFSVVFAVYISLWSVIISLYAAALGLAAGALGGVILGVVNLFRLEFMTGLAAIACALILAGICPPLCMGINICAKALYRALCAFGRWLKYNFVKLMGGKKYA